MKTFHNIILYLILILLSGILLGSCSGEPDPRLISAQRDMDLNPDSILSILDKIDTISFRSHDKATYHLLKTQALDKTNNLNKPYPGIDYALDYFNKHGDNYEKMMANFYKARPFLFNEDYQQAMKYAFLSYQLALKTGDNYWIAKTAEFISDIFSFTTTLDERLKYQQIAVEHYKTAAYLDFYEYALCDLSSALINCGNLSRGLAICDSVMTEAVKKGNYAVADYAKSCLLDGYVRNKNYKKGLDLIRLSDSLPDQSINCYEYIQRATIYLHSNQTDSMWKMLKAAEKIEKFPSEHLGILRVKKEYHNFNGDFEKVIQLQDSIISLNNKEVEDMLAQSGMRVQKNYFSELAKKEEEIADRRLTQIILIISATIIILLLIYLYHRLSIRAKNAEIENKVNDLLSLNSILNNLRNEIENSNTEKVQLLNKVESMFCTQLKIVGQLANDYFECRDSKNTRNYILNKLESEIKKWQKAEKIKELEESFNLYADNIFVRLRNQFPEFKESDITFLIFYWLGFPAKAVALFTGIESKTVYTKKDRLIKKFQKSEAPDKEEFINRTSQRR